MTAAKKAADKVAKTKTGKAAYLGALGGVGIGSATGAISGEVKGRREADSKYTMSKKAAAGTGLVATVKKGRTFQAKGNAAKDAKEAIKGAANKIKDRLPTGRQAKSGAGLAAGAAAGGYVSHKLNEAIQKPAARKNRERSNDRLMKKINKANK